MVALTAPPAAKSLQSYSSRPHELQRTSLLHPWDFPGKSTGVGSHKGQMGVGENAVGWRECYLVSGEGYV